MLLAIGASVAVELSQRMTLPWRVAIRHPTPGHLGPGNAFRARAFLIDAVGAPGAHCVAVRCARARRLPG